MYHILLTCSPVDGHKGCFQLFNRKVMPNSFARPWTVAHQAPLSLGFPRQEYWNGLPFPSPGDLPNPGTGPGLLHCRSPASTREAFPVLSFYKESCY